MPGIVDAQPSAADSTGSARPSSTGSPPSPPGRVVIDGVPVDALDGPGLSAYIVASLQAGRGGWIVNPNVDVLRQAWRDPAIRDLIGQADLVVSDGAPLEWAARLAGSPLPPRVPGSSFIWDLCAVAAREGRSVFLLGGAPGVADRAAVALTAANPGLRVAGRHCPPVGFERRPEEGAAIVAALREAAPDIVFCALGFPKQERLMATLAPLFPATWFIGCGASLTFAAGDVARAPVWMRDAGLEWLFRLLSEPRRLARRYLIDDAPYAVGLLVRSGSRGVAGRLGSRRRLSRTSRGDTH